MAAAPRRETDISTTRLEGHETGIAVITGLMSAVISTVVATQCFDDAPLEIIIPSVTAGITIAVHDALKYLIATSETRASASNYWISTPYTWARDAIACCFHHRTTRASLLKNDGTPAAEPTSA